MFHTIVLPSYVGERKINTDHLNECIINQFNTGNNIDDSTISLLRHQG